MHKDKTIVIEKNEGQYWCAHFDDFINIQESVCAFGESQIEALSKLLLAVGL